MYGLNVDNWSSVIASAHTAGDHAVVLTTLNSLPALPTGRIYRFTAMINPGLQSETILGVFEATGLSGNTLTGVNASLGYTDINLAAGVVVQIRVCKATIDELQTTLDGFGTVATQDADTVAITGGTLAGVTINPHGGGRTVLNSGAFDLGVSDWYARTLNGSNGVLTVSNPLNRQVFVIELIEDGTGNRTVTWFSGITWMTTGGTAPQPAPAVNKISIYTFKQYGTNLYYGFLSGSNA